jgi:hypothetical protein
MYTFSVFVEIRRTLMILNLIKLSETYFVYVIIYCKVLWYDCTKYPWSSPLVEKRMEGPQIEVPTGGGR